MKSEIAHEVVSRAALTRVQTQGMYDLLASYFEGVSPEQFAFDLAEKNWVILLMRGPRLVGFSTLLVYETTFEQEPLSVVYSGDTIVAPEAWGSMALPRIWIASINQLRKVFPRGRYYWLLLTSGFRTYRFLPVFWREFYPRFDYPTPRNPKALLDHLARERFGTQYDSQLGIVRFAHPQQLRGEMNQIPKARMTDPHVVFFSHRNTGYGRGDELVCLTELASANLTAAGHRMVDSKLLCIP
ncbi:hypothetical protein [Pedosphaera parvula]|nr:hypothetical protein [Pedosphaera parvula]